MRNLIVFCHPSKDSYSASLLLTARTALEQSGHEVRVIDLYEEGFNPVLSQDEWDSYIPDTQANIAGVQSHVDAMQWAEALVLVYPTWMYGPPAMLKGWLERVWLPGIAFDIAPAKGKRATGLLRNIRQFTVVTTSGSPWWWLRVIRDPGRSMLARGYRVLFHPLCRVRWLQLHNMNNTTLRDRQRFLARVKRVFSRKALVSVPAVSSMEK
ncbi:MAG: NAD(P)H-dependent oxidoreductase [Rhodobacteraceae bacterium]|nr:NAD(P)H-dependent oxidoreductase [Paracoccaceae bacterium]